MNSLIRPWRLRESSDASVRHLSDELGLSSLAARLLVVRNITAVDEARRFLSSEGEEGHDPALFTEIDEAVDRILTAMERRERVLVHGDYDVDGLTGTAVMVETLRGLGINTEYHIPHRIHDGFGLQPAKVAEIAASFTLMITVDCGTTAFDALDVAAQRGLDVIVTDHHEPGEKRPPCIAILNPGREEESYPWPSLCGSAVAWKLALALRDAAGYTVPLERSGLDLAALGTVADVVPLLGENRLLVQQALPILREHPRVGVRALLEVANTRAADIDTQTIGFRLGPRMNALGRLSNSLDAVELMLTDDEPRAFEIASVMDDLNKKRQSVERKITEQAMVRIEAEGLADDDIPLLCVAGEDWHPGVLGIVASRLVERFHRPAIVLGIQEGEAHGSGRSVEGKSLIGILEESRDLLISGGGHEMAVGLRVSAGNLDQMRERLVDAGRRTWGEKVEPPPLWVDAEIPIEQATLTLLEELQPLAPYGNSNPEPVLVSKARISGHGGQIVGNNHLRFSLEHQRGLTSAIAFGQGHKMDRLTGGAVEVAYHLSRDDYQSRARPQLRVRDVRPVDMDAIPVYSVETDRSDNRKTGADPGPAAQVRPEPKPRAKTAPPPHEGDKRTRKFRCRLDRATVGQVWKMIEKMHTERGVDVEILAALLRMRGMDPECVHASIQVLEDVALLARTGNMVTRRTAASKRDLADSPTYRELCRTE